MDDPGVSRRSFIGTAAGVAATGALWAGAARAGEAAAEPAQTPAQTEGLTPAGPPVGVAMLGAGRWGRELLRRLDLLPEYATLIGYADPAAAALRGAARVVPDVEGFEDPAALMAKPEVQAVFVATPSHLHRQPVADALAAGKHVYCEAPLASSLDEARAIATLGRDAGTVFAVGLQDRADPLANHVLGFVRAGVTGKLLAARAQHHEKSSWYRTSSSAERERELNWRLYQDTSGGLPAEVGVHQLDYVTWALNAMPTAVRGYGSVLYYTGDDRNVPDTVQCVLQYPGGVQCLWDATLGSSYNGTQEALLGSEGTIVKKLDRAWLIKESDATPLGWEVYARQERLGDEMGIALVANSTKLLALDIEPSKYEPSPEELAKDALWWSVLRFLEAVQTGGSPACDAAGGFAATAVALKAHQAVTQGQELAITEADYTL